MAVAKKSKPTTAEKSKTTVAEKSTWLKNVAKNFKATDEEKLQSFQTCALRIYDKNIKHYKQQLENLISSHEEQVERDLEILAEAREDAIAATYNVDLKKLDTRASRESHFRDFDSKISCALDNLDELKAITAAKVKTFEDSKKALKDTISKLEFKRSLIV